VPDKWELMCQEYIGDKNMTHESLATKWSTPVSSIKYHSSKEHWARQRRAYWSMKQHEDVIIEKARTEIVEKLEKLFNELTQLVYTMD
jgi:hypothetical protein